MEEIMKRLSGILILFLTIFINPILCHSYDNDILHRLINENAAMSSKTNDALKEYGIAGGLFDKVGSNRILEWIIEGGFEEDEPFYQVKVVNHFHDPTQSWDKTTDNARLQYWPTNVWGTRSSVRWAQHSANSWSWQKAREKMYKGLTSISESKREEYLADAFQALGQVMHLIADSACPPHVRNDPHPPWEASPYETYCENNATKIPFAGANPVPISIFQTSSVPGMEPITNLWDTDNSAGYNPAIGSNSPNIGLAEYTNYNFFSKDTVFDPDYTYPAIPSTQWQIKQNSIGEKTAYYFGSTSDGIPVEHYAKIDYLFPELIAKNSCQQSGFRVQQKRSVS